MVSFEDMNQGHRLRASSVRALGICPQCLTCGRSCPMGPSAGAGRLGWSAFSIPWLSQSFLSSSANCCRKIAVSSQRGAVSMTPSESASPPSLAASPGNFIHLALTQGGGSHPRFKPKEG